MPCLGSDFQLSELFGYFIIEIGLRLGLWCSNLVTRIIQNPKFTWIHTRMKLKTLPLGCHSKALAEVCFCRWLGQRSWCSGSCEGMLEILEGRGWMLRGLMGLMGYLVKTDVSWPPFPAGRRFFCMAGACYGWPTIYPRYTQGLASCGKSYRWKQKPCFLGIDCWLLSGRTIMFLLSLCIRQVCLLSRSDCCWSFCSTNTRLCLQDLGHSSNVADLVSWTRNSLHHPGIHLIFFYFLQYGHWLRSRGTYVHLWLIYVDLYALVPANSPREQGLDHLQPEQLERSAWRRSTMLSRACHAPWQKGRIWPLPICIKESTFSRSWRLLVHHLNSAWQVLRAQDSSRWRYEVDWWDWWDSPFVAANSSQELQVVHATVAVLQQMAADLPSQGTWVRWNMKNQWPSVSSVSFCLRGVASQLVGLDS